MWTTHQNALPFLFENCERVQYSLFFKGHLVRGVLIKDKHYSGDVKYLDTRSGSDLLYLNNILVSPALVRAFIEEKKLMTQL